MLERSSKKPRRAKRRGSSEGQARSNGKRQSPKTTGTHTGYSAFSPLEDPDTIILASVPLFGGAVWFGHGFKGSF